MIGKAIGMFLFAGASLNAQAPVPSQPVVTATDAVARGHRVPEGLGEIVASMLSTEQFVATYGSGWILADGRAVPNTEYARYVGPRVPDLRGIFLRGRNYGRPRNEGNAEGDLPTGHYQSFQISRHAHGTTQMIYDNNVDGVDSCCLRSGDHHNEGRMTAEAGGDEVRPNSVTVNYFIRVGR